MTLSEGCDIKIKFDSLNLFLANAHQKPDGGWSHDLNVRLLLHSTALSLFLSLRGCNMPVWSLVLPLWAVWKIHQAFPLESVWIREQALQWPHTRRIYLSIDAWQRKCCIYETQNHNSRPIFCFFFFAAGQVKHILYVLYMQIHTHTHNHQQSWMVKNRWTIPFSVQAFHTDGARPDLYCVRVWEQLALSGAIPPGRTANTAPSTSEHAALPAVKKSYTETLKHWGWTGNGQNNRNTWQDNSPAITYTFMKDTMICALVALHLVLKGLVN